MDRRMGAALDRYITGNWGEDSVSDVPPSCEECPEEKFEKCPGQDKCIEVLLDSHPACCIKHRVEIQGWCGDCEAEVFSEQI